MSSSISKLQHVAIIMDGNGRWAKRRGHSRVWGHIRGAKVAKSIIEFAARSKLQCLTLFAFSTENWRRPQAEVEFLMSLLMRYLKSELKLLQTHNIQFLCVGDQATLPGPVKTVVQETIYETRNNTGLKLIFALNYGGRQEIARAAQRLAQMCLESKLRPEEISEEVFSCALDTAELPDPDLIVRTSGESRISNFQLWQGAYSEICFVDKLWPDFTIEDMAHVIEIYQGKERRFGRTSEQVHVHSSR